MRPSSTPSTHSRNSSAHAQLIEALEKARDKLVIVEGKKDEQALRALGFTHILPINNQPLYKIVENIHEDEVIILTDLDREGKRLYALLRTDLQRYGIKINNHLRDALYQTTLRQIEGITKLWKSIEE